MANDASTVFDLVILGGGSGGYARGAPRGAAGPGRRPDREGQGRRHLHLGCIPTKALLHAGEIADQARESEQFGVKATFEGIDVPAVHKYKDGVISGLYKGLQGLIASRKVTYIEGEGRLSSPTSVDANGQRVQGRHVLLATLAVEPLPGLVIDGNRIISSDHALVLDRVPQSAIVLGGGVIGVEFASAWKSFGTQRDGDRGPQAPRPGRGRDLLKSSRQRAFRKRGIKFNLGTLEGRVHPGRCQGHPRRRQGVRGRGPARRRRPRPGLGRSRLRGARRCDDCGYVLVDEYMRTNVLTISAVGDLVPTLQLAHVGFAEGILVAERLAGLKTVPIDYDGVPRVTYCHPRSPPWASPRPRPRRSTARTRSSP